MKKTLSFLLALIMICCMAVSAYADGNEMLVSLTVDETLESYEVVIPPIITLDAATFATNGGGKTPLNVTISKLTAIWSTDFSIFVTSKNGCYLVNTEDSSKMIPYLLTTPVGNKRNGFDNKTIPTEDSYFSESIAILQERLPYNTTDTSGGYIERYGSDAYPGGGTYTDTLTFTFEFHIN